MIFDTLTNGEDRPISYAGPLQEVPEESRLELDDCLRVLVPSYRGTTEQDLASNIGENATVFVAETNDQIIGTATAYPMNGSGYRKRFLGSAAVRTEFQGRGAFHQLKDAIDFACQKNEQTAVRLAVAPDNPARQSYEHQGAIEQSVELFRRDLDSTPLNIEIGATSPFDSVSITTPTDQYTKNEDSSHSIADAQSDLNSPGFSRVEVRNLGELVGSCDVRVVWEPLAGHFLYIDSVEVSVTARSHTAAIVAAILSPLEKQAKAAGMAEILLDLPKSNHELLQALEVNGIAKNTGAIIMEWAVPVSSTEAVSVASS